MQLKGRVCIRRSQREELDLRNPLNSHSNFGFDLVGNSDQTIGGLWAGDMAQLCHTLSRLEGMCGVTWEGDYWRQKESNSNI